MTTNSLGSIFILTATQYSTLVADGTLTLSNGNVITYNSNTIYLVQNGEDFLTDAEVETLLAGKQDTISDLSTIRSNASTALSKSTTNASDIDTLETSLATETNARTSADTTLQSNIDTLSATVDTKASQDTTYTKTEVNTLISNLKKATLQVVSELPTTGEEGYIYLVGSSTPYEMYTYESEWIHLGTTDIDLSDYYTKSETDSLLSSVDATTLKGYGVSSGKGKGVVTIGEDLVAEFGKYIDMHNSATSTNDYDCRIKLNSETQNTLTLPSSTGTLALTSDIPTAVSSLTNDSGYQTSSEVVALVQNNPKYTITVSGSTLTITENY